MPGTVFGSWTVDRLVTPPPPPPRVPAGSLLPSLFSFRQPNRTGPVGSNPIGLFCFYERLRLDRTYAPPAVPTIEPINDDYLTSFGRSYANVKSLAQEKKDEKIANKMAKRVKRGGQKGEGKGEVEGEGEGEGEEGKQSGGGVDDDDDVDGGSSDDSGNTDDSGDSSDDSDDSMGDSGQKRADATNDVTNGVASGDGGGGSRAAGGEVVGSPAAADGTAPRGRARKKHGVFVVNLPFALCEEKKLVEIFSGFGRVTGVVLSRPPEGRT